MHKRLINNTYAKDKGPYPRTEQRESKKAQS